MLLSNVLILKEKEPHRELLQSAALWRADPQRENEKPPTAISAHSRVVPAAIGLCLVATCTAYTSQLSHVVMFPPRKKVCRIALSLSLRVFILGVNIPQKPSATRLTEMRTKALLLKLRGDSLST